MGWLNTVTVENVHPNTTVALRVKGLSGSADVLKLTVTVQTAFQEARLEDLWHIQTEEGAIPDTLSEDVLYEIHVLVQDGGISDLSEMRRKSKYPLLQLSKKGGTFSERFGNLLVHDEITGAV